MANIGTQYLFVIQIRDSLLCGHLGSHIAQASVMASALDGTHDVIHQAHAVL